MSLKALLPAVHKASPLLLDWLYQFMWYQGPGSRFLGSDFCSVYSIYSSLSISTARHKSSFFFTRNIANTSKLLCCFSPLWAALPDFSNVSEHLITSWLHVSVHWSHLLWIWTHTALPNIQWSTNWALAWVSSLWFACSLSCSQTLSLIGFHSYSGFFSLCFCLFWFSSRLHF